MSQDLYTYLQQLQAYVQMQEQRIQKLESSMKKMKEEMAQNDRQPIHIDRIEYKFDQLKVETLEGTLNIGLNPSDLQDIDDFSVDQKELQTPYSPKKLFKRNMEIETALLTFIEGELPQIVEEAEANLKMPNDSSYVEFIKEDIKKQLSSRVDYYLKQQSNRNLDSQEEKTKVIETLKTEIRNGVYAFLSHLPENMKEMKKE
ncbi:MULTISPECIES: spore germination protein GerPC [Cytobacillus]|uniref:spore germination protein GerPC n=1 Tax=Cytobacillus TaxID=2675230 RepID=UPI001CD7148A|nr:spore germination protein GerPC [Cytobacillus kochii]MCA1027421.1 spore germination protein GerPC [Cytobacillus kochii]MCM3322068.1 spore germination protein GerPC [Cytobacillus kochii]MCM3343100.1 spore germination protein GerPC [Cytobacillus kochii]MDM5206930.1 spore germination protein GerPC [Cytobacillus kochii]